MLNDRGSVRRLRITVQGIVQGVGFRPFVYRVATDNALVGWVRNTSAGVDIEVQGSDASLDRFVRTVRQEPPRHALINRCHVTEVLRADELAFRIDNSGGEEDCTAVLPADLATCELCIQEFSASSERRFQYPFTNCTECGPRFSIIESMPYDRPRTTMRAFSMCSACRAEYINPRDRRFHAQPIACPECGPHVFLTDSIGRVLAERELAVEQAGLAICGGRIVALKGIGGYQILVDATNEYSVAELRRRKHRDEKPFALMCRSLEMVEEYCEVSENESQWLRSAQAPIVLLKRHKSRPSDKVLGIADCVAPRNTRLGIMLPYTPLHHLLLERLEKPIVCTSGNHSEEPICIDDDDALQRLSEIADVFLTHDRRIVRHVDDSVGHWDGSGFQLLRRARGFAPLPIDLGLDGPTILAVGGQLKSCVALRIGSQVVLSQCIGDLGNAGGRALFERTIEELVSFYSANVRVIACDCHPDYASTIHATALAKEWGVPILSVQHHHAHIASAMAEHGLEGEALGLSWDGTGYGTDGTIWGGEALLCSRTEFRRIGSLRPFALPGGEKAIKEPRRAALGLLYAMIGCEAEKHARAWFAKSEWKAILGMLSRSVNCPRTTSMGRLFDAVAAIIGVRTVDRFEGQAAMELQFAAEEVAHADPYPFSLCKGDFAQADWEPMIREIVSDVTVGAPTGVIAAKFHAWLGSLAVEWAKVARQQRVVLSGGCFQNLLLAKTVRHRLEDAGYEVFTHRLVPPNDGGIALGQVLVAAALCSQNETSVIKSKSQLGSAIQQ
ncbi:MAG: carbamoyltransferase HypF [Planctomycetota bacterium]